MAKKLPPDAFDFYFSLGPQRSYQAVAQKYGASKRAVTALAKRERWQERLEKVEAEARTTSDQKKVAAQVALKERHLQALRLVLGKGIDALMQMHFTTPMDAARAIGLAVRELRVELGEPSERTAISIEDTIKREYERWMVEAEPESSQPEPGHKGDNGAVDNAEDDVRDEDVQ